MAIRQKQPWSRAGRAVISLLLVIVLAAPASAQFFKATDFFQLMRDFKRVLEMPETTAAERERKIANLTRQFTLRGTPDESITTRARRMWTSATGAETRNGTPLSMAGSAGTEPKHGYRPRLIDLYAHWKAASLATDPGARTRLYRVMLLALPADRTPPGGAPTIYESPVVSALVADARCKLGEFTDAAMRQWLEDEDAAKVARDMLELVRSDLKPARNSPLLDNTVTDAIADTLYRDYQRVTGELQTIAAARR